MRKGEGISLQILMLLIQQELYTKSLSFESAMKYYLLWMKAALVFPCSPVKKGAESITSKLWLTAQATLPTKAYLQLGEPKRGQKLMHFKLADFV